MQKWEYLFVEADWIGDYWYPRYLNTVELPNWNKGQQLAIYANELGKQGWELVSAPYVHTGSYTRPSLIFKRSLE